MSKEAMELAMDLALMHHSDPGYSEFRAKVRCALRKALAAAPQPAPQPAQQEPVYVQTRHKTEHGFSEWGSLLDPAHRNSKWADGVEMRLLYTTPQAQPAPQPEQSESIGINELEVVVRANFGGSEFVSAKRWSEAWALRDLDRIVANDMHSIRNQITAAARGIKVINK